MMNEPTSEDQERMNSMLVDYGREKCLFSSLFERIENLEAKLNKTEEPKKEEAKIEEQRKAVKDANQASHLFYTVIMFEEKMNALYQKTSSTDYELCEERQLGLEMVQAMRAIMERSNYFVLHRDNFAQYQLRSKKRLLTMKKKRIMKKQKQQDVEDKSP